MLSLLLCAATVCSDDMLGVLGNERICWDPAARATSYEVAADGVLCVSVLEPATCDDLLSTCRGDAIRVRACNSAGCAAWSAPVEVLPFACTRAVECHRSDDGDSRNDGCTTCEQPCWIGAPRRLSHLLECPP